MEFAPPVILEKAPDAAGPLWIAREDLLPGGTKQRGTLPFLRYVRDQGYAGIVYASPFAGYAQVALAEAARQLGMTCRLFCEKDPAPGPRRLHPYSELARSYGADVDLCDSLPEAETQSLTVDNHLFKVPLGLAHPEFFRVYEAALKTEWATISKHFGNTLELWLSVGSGTLAQTFLNFLPDSVTVYGVNVRVLKDSDPRLATLSRFAHFHLIHAAERFQDSSRTLPPYPSNAHYDAKVWAFATSQTKSGVQKLLWNVAR